MLHGLPDKSNFSCPSLNPFVVVVMLTCFYEPQTMYFAKKKKPYNLQFIRSFCDIAVKHAGSIIVTGMTFL